MFATLPLPFYFLIGVLLSIFLPKGVIKSSFVCLVPVIALLVLLNGTWDGGLIVQFLDLELNLMRVDKLSMVFGIIFCIAAFLGNVFAFHLREGLIAQKHRGQVLILPETDHIYSNNSPYFLLYPIE